MAGFNALLTTFFGKAGHSDLVSTRQLERHRLEAAICRVGTVNPAHKQAGVPT